ncbi:DUF4199 domain-containing protein [Marinoscillum sp.]|uniref:DUF4199 domain-containing protein n=1 Tax=Marinoscillum sp. TaxID=2024838 RepID=UPI003BA95996
MEETKDVSKKSVAIKYGIIGALISIIVFVVQDFAGIAGNPDTSWIATVLSIVIYAGIIFVAQNDYKKNGDGHLNYGEGLGLGTLLSLVSSVISSIFTYIYVSFINPTFIENIRQTQIQALEEQGMTDAQIEQSMGVMEAMSGPTAMLIFGILGGVFFGFIVSLIVTAFTKKSRPEFE